MELMLRRGLMAMSSGGLTTKTGTFTGDGTMNASLSIGFEPDIVLVESDVDYSVSGWQGVGHVFIWRGVTTGVKRHPNTTTTSATTNMNPFVDATYPYGRADTAGSYQIYCSYGDGVLSLTNKNDGVGTRYINGKTYNWTAIKF